MHGRSGVYLLMDRYDCPSCAELERQFIQIHDSLYSMKESEDMRVVFAIARFENAYSFFDEVYSAALFSS